MSGLQKILREPLLHFLVLGAGLFVLYGVVGKLADESSDRIVVTEAKIGNLAGLFERTWRRPPTPAELDGLIEDHLKEEIFYREALALGLDRDDTVIRRQLRLKMQFISEDVAPQTEPTEAELRAFLAEHADRFRTPSRISFTQVYLSPDRRGENAWSDAERLLVALNTGKSDPAEAGDPFLLEQDYRDLAAPDVERLFGQAFAARVGRAARSAAGPGRSSPATGCTWSSCTNGPRRACLTSPRSVTRSRTSGAPSARRRRTGRSTKRCARATRSPSSARNRPVRVRPGWRRTGEDEAKPSDLELVDLRSGARGPGHATVVRAGAGPSRSRQGVAEPGRGDDQPAVPEQHLLQRRAGRRHGERAEHPAGDPDRYRAGEPDQSHDLPADLPARRHGGPGRAAGGDLGRLDLRARRHQLHRAFSRPRSRARSPGASAPRSASRARPTRSSAARSGAPGRPRSRWFSLARS